MGYRYMNLVHLLIDLVHRGDPWTRVHVLYSLMIYCILVFNQTTLMPCTLWLPCMVSERCNHNFCMFVVSGFFLLFTLLHN